MYRVLALSLCTSGLGQRAGDLVKENHPKLTVALCTKAGDCVNEQKAVTIDANWRWVHKVGNYTNCYTGASWDPAICPDPVTCAKDCAIEGADKEYAGTYGVIASGSTLQLNFVTQTNIGSRVYLLEDEETYKLFKLKNREFTFDVDVSQLPCGLNGAMYFIAMDADGGLSRYPRNKAGAKYGTGYCDAQCPHDIKFINGEANSKGWQTSKTDPTTGKGHYGTCCTEFDIWESNSMGMAYTAHACNVTEPTRCEGAGCGDNGDTPSDQSHRFDGYCDKSGCDFQTYRLGSADFWGVGPSFAIDTSKPMTVTTQFITADGTDTGALKEIRRYYQQGGKTIQTPMLKVGSEDHDSLTKEFCQAEVDLFNDTNFLEKGGFEATDAAFEKGMVLALSLWDDHFANMLWLDSTFPVGSTDPGAARGPCPSTSGVPKDVETQHPNAHVKYSNIRYGEIGSTSLTPVVV